MKSFWLILSYLMGVQAFAQDRDIDSLYSNDWGVGQNTSRDSRGTAFNPQQGVDLTCTDKTQRSIPLYLFAGLLANKGSGIKYNYDGKRRKLVIDFGLMMDACNDKIAFDFGSENDKYIVEAVLKDGATYEEFKECALSNMEAGKPKDITQTSSVKIGLENVKPNQEIIFASEGPYANIKTLYNVKGTNGCKVYEGLGNELMLASKFDERYIDEQEKLAKICESGDYQEILANIGKFENFGDVLKSVAAGLIDEKVKEATKQIRRKKLENIDFDVFDDFDTYVLDPMVQEIEMAYSELATLEVNSKAYDQKKRELDKLKRNLAAYSRDPYPSVTERDILLANGYFSEEALIFKLNTKVAATRMINDQKDGKVIDPQRAVDIADGHVADHGSWLDEQRKNYRIQNGEITGESDKYYEVADAYEAELEAENANYTRVMQDLQLMKQKIYQRCYQRANQWSPPQKCLVNAEKFIVTSERTIQEEYLNAKKSLEKEIADYNRKGDYYAALEAKAQGGDRPSVVEKTENVGKYSFDYEGVVSQYYPEFFSEENGQGAQPNQQQLQYQQYMQWQQQQQQQQQGPQGQYNYNQQYYSNSNGPATSYMNPNSQYSNLYNPNAHMSPNYNNGFNPGAYNFNYQSQGQQPRQPAFNNGFPQGQQNPYYNPQMNGGYYGNQGQMGQMGPGNGWQNQPPMTTPGYNPGANSNGMYQFNM